MDYKVFMEKQKTQNSQVILEEHIWSSESDCKTQYKATVVKTS